MERDLTAGLASEQGRAVLGPPEKGAPGRERALETLLGVRASLGKEGLEERAAVLRLVADAVAAGREEGLPVVVEPVAAGGTHRIEVAEIERRELEAARIAIEVGADIIKMRIWDTARFEKFVANCPVPVVALGGGLSGGSSGVLDVVKRGMDIGLAGVFVGRNVWQRPEEEALVLMNEICSLVHSDGRGASGRR